MPAWEDYLFTAMNGSWSPPIVFQILMVTYAQATFAIVVTLGLTFGIAPVRGFESATADDTARFLAGLSPSSDFPLTAQTKDPAWAAHARYFDSIFAREESTSLSKVREFSKKYLTEKHDTMLYMFSGPDFLYATSFQTRRRMSWPASNR
jgi:hypothetical protein